MLIAGYASMGKDFEKTSQSDLETGEMFGIPIALIILALVFGALVASVIPIVLALVAIVLAVGGERRDRAAVAALVLRRPT